ncbi:hypothetical protein [Neorhizobium tomejilense]|uniref:hypothetical protein n=1 Tax=Neorhizobium tomejilense TaxID=2093828 RepID=UPI003ED0B05C
MDKLLAIRCITFTERIAHQESTARRLRFPVDRARTGRLRLYPGRHDLAFPLV